MDLDDLLTRVTASVGPAVFEEPERLPDPPAPRETWIELQGPLVAAATNADPGARRHAAATLLRAVLDQPSYGPSNRLSAEAFELIHSTTPDGLAAALDPAAGHPYGGRRYLLWHLWAVPGPAGARGLRELAAHDPTAVGFLIQDMHAGTVARWAPDDWPDRLDALAALPTDPRPYPIGLVTMLEPPAPALPALVRLALAHGRDATDHVVRATAGHVASARTGEPHHDRHLVDWQALAAQADLGRWLLELAGGDTDRGPLVAAALRAGQLDRVDADALAAPLDRPAWADGEVPWTLDEVAVAVGSVRLPGGRLSGGDPWWTGGHEGVPWTLEVPPGEYPVDVLVADHPLAPRECAALRLAVRPIATPVRWDLMSDTRTDEERDGYVTEVGVASLGATAVYEAAIIHEAALRTVTPGARAAWELLDGGDHGTAVMCTVGPQHQTCRSWAARDIDGRLVAVVTDLGLLAPDPDALWRATV